ncbi:hypothetical protein SAMN06265367_101499 [Algoriphagus winogradskyi]|uniref:Uncharacterized protein n=1 Tax=Algoriphagus winogradskyi TaxID=237017 RepID=A0ABY1NCW6_9BACT|nr:hypothetical protein SAMN06265367_101499 [Algoriphagus winogradskyi]
MGTLQIKKTESQWLSVISNYNLGLLNQIFLARITFQKLDNRQKTRGDYSLFNNF